MCVFTQSTYFLSGIGLVSAKNPTPRLLPLINSILPCPEVWEITKNNQESKELVVLPPEQLANGRALVDATEQRVSRPGKSNETRKLYYSGKKKAFTIKT